MAAPPGMGTVMSCTTSTGTLTLGKIRGVEFSGADGPAIDVTTMDSTGNWRVFIGGGPIDPGEVTIDVVFYTTASGIKQFVDSLHAGTAQDYTMTYNTTGTDTRVFNAIVTGISESLPLDGEVSRSVTMKISKTAGFTT